MQQLLLEDKKVQSWPLTAEQLFSVVVIKLGCEAFLSSPKFIFTVTAILPAEHELLGCWHLHTVHVSLHDIQQWGSIKAAGRIEAIGGLTLFSKTEGKEHLGIIET